MRSGQLPGPELPDLSPAAVRAKLTAYPWQEERACLRFVPLPLATQRLPESILDGRWKALNPRQGAVLMLFLLREDGLRILLTERHPGLRHHAGEFSLPGGGVDQSDASKLATALRETEEEIGLPSEAVELWGRLDGLYVPPSNFSIVPYTGFVLDASAIKPSDPEVSRVVEFPLAALFEREAVRKEEINVYTAEFYEWQSHRVWGATARILNNVSEVLGEPCQPWHLTHGR